MMIDGVDLTGNPGIFYTDRPDDSAPFRAVVRLTDVPLIDELDLTDDCGRVYFPALGSIIYLQQS